MKLVACCVVALAVTACSTKVKQARSPIMEEYGNASESDMAAAPEKGPAPVIRNDAQIRTECCQQCVDGLAQDKMAASDKSGNAAAKIPCADYTWVLKEECLAFFRKTPMMASEAKVCVAPAPKATTAPAAPPAKAPAGATKDEEEEE